MSAGIVAADADDAIARSVERAGGRAVEAALLP
jgi:hypothetical protein